LTCKDSVLVGWGGALEGDNISCPVLEAQHPGSTINVERCTLQLHPDSTYPKLAIILKAAQRASIIATDCKLVGPAPGNSSGRETAAFAETHATICLVSAAAHPSQSAIKAVLCDMQAESAGCGMCSRWPGCKLPAEDLQRSCWWQDSIRETCCVGCQATAPRYVHIPRLALLCTPAA
jgi:hypothetical protein